MAVHFFLLTLSLFSSVYSYYSANYFSYKINNVITIFVYCLLAYIMDQVNGPQYTVWANRKFVGKNTRAVSDYILEGRESINC